MIEIRQVPTRSRARVADPRLGALATSRKWRVADVTLSAEKYCMFADYIQAALELENGAKVKFTMDDRG